MSLPAGNDTLSATCPSAGEGSVFRRQRWTAKFLLVAPGDLQERFPVEEVLIGGWQSERCGGFPTFAEEPLNTGRPEEQEQAGFCRINVERVRDVARAIDKRASPRLDKGLTVLDTNLAREDQEELVLPSMDMQGRTESFGRQELDRGEPSFRLVPVALRRPSPPLNH